MRTRELTRIVCGLLLAAATTLAALTPEQTREAQALIAQFTAAEFATRQAAVEKLVAMGKDVVPLVRAALERTTDAEVKLRCEMVLKALGEKPPATDARAAARPLEERVVAELGPSRTDTTISRSANGETVAWVEGDGRWRVVVNGREGPWYDKVEQPYVSPDGKHVAYKATRVFKSFVVRDGVEEPPYPGIMWPYFSPDSRRLHYAAGSEGNQFVVCDGKQWKPYDRVLNTRFSPDSKHVVFTAQQGDRQFLVIDFIEGPTHKWVWFHRASERLRYIVIDEGRARGVEVDYPADEGDLPERNQKMSKKS